jgi:hypothetical protein
LPHESKSYSLVTPLVLGRSCGGAGPDVEEQRGTALGRRRRRSEGGARPQVEEQRAALGVALGEGGAGHRPTSAGRPPSAMPSPIAVLVASSPTLFYKQSKFPPSSLLYSSKNKYSN